MTIAIDMAQAGIPEKIQSEAGEVLRASGLTFSEVFRALVTTIAREKTVPQAIFQPNPETLEAFAAAERGELEAVTLGELRRQLYEND